MEGFFTAKTFLRLFAAALVLAAIIVLVTERIENSRNPETIAQREITRVVNQTVVVTQLVQHVVTATPLSTPILTPTLKETALPTATLTPEKLAVAADGLLIWCLPLFSTTDSSVIPVTGGMPEEAVRAEKVDGITTVTTQMKSCMFTFTFSKPVGEGLQLHFQDQNPEPFLTVDLNPANGLTNSGYANLEHSWIVDPPFWRVDYTLRVVNAEGDVIWEDVVAFNRGWQPDPCPDGRMPDANTLQCAGTSE